MKLSIVTPCYNVAPYLPAYFESLFNQQFNDFEVICVDDASTDNTWEILQEYARKDQRIRIHQLPQNSGGCKIPKETGIALSHNDWILVLDSDDVIDGGYIYELVKRQQETGADVVCTRVETFHEQPHDISGWFIPGIDFDYSQLLTGRQAVILTVRKWQINVAGMLHKKSTYSDCQQLLKPRPALGRDFADEFTSRVILMQAEKVAFVNQTYWYRENPDSVTRRKDKIKRTYNTDYDIWEMLSEQYGEDSQEARIAKTAYLENLVRTKKTYGDKVPDVQQILSHLRFKDIWQTKWRLHKKISVYLSLLLKK